MSATGDLKQAVIDLLATDDITKHYPKAQDRQALLIKAGLADLQGQVDTQDLPRTFFPLLVNKIWDDQPQADQQETISVLRVVQTDIRGKGRKQVDDILTRLGGQAASASQPSSAVGSRSNIEVKTFAPDTATLAGTRPSPATAAPAGGIPSMIPWWRNPAIVVPALAVVLGAIISAPWWTPLLDTDREALAPTLTQTITATVAQAPVTPLATVIPTPSVSWIHADFGTCDGWRTGELAKEAGDIGNATLGCSGGQYYIEFQPKSGFDCFSRWRDYPFDTGTVEVTVLGPLDTPGDKQGLAFGWTDWQYPSYAFLVDNSGEWWFAASLSEDLPYAAFQNQKGTISDFDNSIPHVLKAVIQGDSNSGYTADVYVDGTKCNKDPIGMPEYREHGETFIGLVASQSKEAEIARKHLFSDFRCSSQEP